MSRDYCFGRNAAARMTSVELAASAHQRQQEIKVTISEMRASWLTLARQLYEFSETKAWRHLGYESFEAWLGDPEIDLKRRSAFYAIEAYRELVVKRGATPTQLEGLDVSKVRAVLPAIRRERVSVEDALQDVRVMGRRDIEVRYREIAAGDNGHPDAEDEPEWRQCPTCGSMIR